jgi:hypothetical protein
MLSPESGGPPGAGLAELYWTVGGLLRLVILRQKLFGDALFDSRWLIRTSNFARKIFW